MAESLSFPGDLAECHRLMAQQQALFAGLEQRAAEQQRQYTDLEQVLDRTAKDLEQLREDHQKAIDELRSFRRWVYGSRRAPVCCPH